MKQIRSSAHEALLDIGFNSQIELGHRSLHVQTEVTGTQPLVARTTVHEGGTVRHSESRPLPAGADDVAAARSAIEGLHRAVVARAERNEF